MNRRRLYLHQLLAFAIASCAGAGWAQSPAAADWPNKPIRVIVPAPAGGAYDLTIRPLALELAQLLGQPLVIDNRPSAGNIVGTTAGARALPDGYTITLTGMLNTMSHSLYTNVPFDIVQDFAHVAGLSAGAQWLVVRPDLGVNNLAELIDKAKRDPGKLNYASSGAGSTGHLLMEQLQRVTQTRLTHVPYKGGAPALQDVLAGVVPITVVPPAGAEAHVKAGKLKVLAISSEKRSAQYPDVPTFAEQGYKQLTVSSWVGLSFPKGTHPDTVRKMNEAVQAGLARPAVAAQFEKLGMSAMPLTPQAYGQLVQSDTERWGQLIRGLNLKAE